MVGSRPSRDPEASAARERSLLDAELYAALSAMSDRPPLGITAGMIPELRRTPDLTEAEQEALLDERGLRRTETTLPGYKGDEIRVVIVARGDSDSGAPRPCLFHVHGGGMILGSPLDGLLSAADWVMRHDAVAVSVDYRLAPECPDPYPVEDCYAGLLWTVEHADRWGIDPQRIVLVGISAGGGLAAGTALLARDRGGPEAIGQMLMGPMLDDRDRTVSTRQIDGIACWDRGSNRTGWTALLGDRRGTDDVSIYAAPARATDLTGLPPTFIDCGTVEVFRDEDVAYASALCAAGVPTELHVWAGGFHGFEEMVPDARISRSSAVTRAAWIDRILSR